MNACTKFQFQSIQQLLYISVWTEVADRPTLLPLEWLNMAGQHWVIYVSFAHTLYLLVCVFNIISLITWDVIVVEQSDADRGRHSTNLPARPTNKKAGSGGPQI